MTSNRDKGNAFVGEAIKNYEALGFLCWKPGNMAIWIPDPKNPKRRIPISQSQDICRAFDFLFWSGNNIGFVQVKADEGDACKARKLIDDIGFPSLAGMSREVLMRIKGKKATFVWWHSTRDGEWIRGELRPPSPTPSDKV